MGLMEKLKTVADSLAHWNDAVAVSKAIEQFRELVMDYPGVAAVSIAEESSGQMDRGGREVEVVVTMREPSEKEAEHFVGFVTNQVNIRYRTHLRPRIIPESR